MERAWRGFWDGYYEHHRKTSGDGSDISHYTMVEDLEVLRAYRFGKIDRADTEIINWGYEFQPNTGAPVYLLPLTYEARDDLMATAITMTWPEMSGLVFPTEFPTKDETKAPLVVNDEAEFKAMAITALVRAKTVMGYGAALRAAVRSATSKAAIDAVVDDRLTTWVKPTGD